MPDVLKLLLALSELLRCGLGSFFFLVQLGLELQAGRTARAILVRDTARTPARCIPCSEYVLEPKMQLLCTLCMLLQEIQATVQKQVHCLVSRWPVWLTAP